MTPPQAPRVIRLAHSSPGRLRLRLPWLRRDQAAATALADHLAGLDAVIEVAVRPRTGSVLCRFDSRRTSPAKLVAAVRRQTHVTTVLRTGEPLPPAVRAARPPGSALGHALADAFRGIDDDVYEATLGRIDLGALAGLGLLAAGATEIAVTRQIPAPPWFSLAWWAFRTFTMFEQNHAPAPAPRRDELAAARRRAARRRARPSRSENG